MCNVTTRNIEFESKSRERCIWEAMETIQLGGNIYTSEDALFQQCLRENRYLRFSEFHNDLRWMIQKEVIKLEGRRLYGAAVLQYENAVAERLADILLDNDLEKPEVPETLFVGDITLTQEQRQSVVMALSYRISVLIGPAGSGKSTLIQAIAEHCPTKGRQILCAPTGKAARSLKERTGLNANTIHGAMGIRLEELDAPVAWNHVPLVVVDEASMMTLEMLQWILERVSDTCSVVLVGDPHQLPSVGPGNVLCDLLALGFPSTALETIHRQGMQDTALRTNIKNFHQLTQIHQLEQDDSFQFIETEEEDIADKLCATATAAYQQEISVQVLTPYNTAGKLSAAVLNESIASRVNPRKDTRSFTLSQHPRLCDGDRVIITKNSRSQDCSNGDVGILHFKYHSDIYPMFFVDLQDGRKPSWRNLNHLQFLLLAYAITVHKAQGSEYDTIILPLSSGAANMMTHNLLYTAISRAKKKVILIGSRQALESAMQKKSPDRNSMLVSKTRMILHQKSA